MNKREVEQDGGEKTDPDLALDEQAEIGIGFLLDMVWIFNIPNCFKFISGIACLVVLFFYILGMSYKLYKIHHGTYVEEEPVFLKYK